MCVYIYIDIYISDSSETSCVCKIHTEGDVMSQKLCDVCSTKGTIFKTLQVSKND